MPNAPKASCEKPEPIQRRLISTGLDDAYASGFSPDDLKARDQSVSGTHLALCTIES